MTGAALLRGAAAPAVIVVLFACVPLATRDDYALGVWTFVLLNIIVVLGLDLLTGYAGQLSLGHGAFVAIGAYASALLTSRHGWSGWAAIPVGMLVATATAVVIGIPTLRLRGYFLAMATLGFPILFDAVTRVGSSWSGGSSGVTAIPRLSVGGWVLRDPTAFYFVVLAFMVVFLVACWTVLRSRAGLVLRAIQADETAAEARGIHVTRWKLAAFAISAAIAAISGSLYVHNVQFVAANTFGVQYSLMLVVMLVAGGMGRVWGGVLGVIVFTWLPELLRGVANWQPVIFGSVLAAVMLASPHGLAGLVRRRSAFVPAESDALERSGRRSTAGVVLAVSGLRKRYGGVTAVDDLEFDVRSAEIRSIVGPNGAGKSTALALISGALASDRGIVRIKGVDCAAWPAHRRARFGLGRTFQHARLIESLTVFENLVLGASSDGCASRIAIDSASRLLSRLGLEPFARRFPEEIDHYARRLTEVGVALAAAPDLLLLDEPAAGLAGPEIERLSVLLARLREGGTAIVLVDHVMSLVMPLSDRILVLDHGVRIADGSPRAVMADSLVRAAYLGEQATHA